MTPARERELTRMATSMGDPNEVTGFLRALRQQNECSGEIMAALKRKCKQEGWPPPA